MAIVFMAVILGVLEAFLWVPGDFRWLPRGLRGISRVLRGKESSRAALSRFRGSQGSQRCSSSVGLRRFKWVSGAFQGVLGGFRGF